MDPLHLVAFAVTIAGYIITNVMHTATVDTNTALISLASLSIGVAAGKGAKS